MSSDIFYSISPLSSINLLFLRQSLLNSSGSLRVFYFTLPFPGTSSTAFHRAHTQTKSYFLPTRLSFHRSFFMFQFLYVSNIVGRPNRQRNVPGKHSQPMTSLPTPDRFWAGDRISFTCAFILSKRTSRLFDN